MKYIKFASVLVVLMGLAGVAFAIAPAAYGHPQAQGRVERAEPLRELTILGGRGSEIGVSIRDIESADKAEAGVVVEEVRAEGPAEKAGLKRADVIVEFDGERVRSARQFTRLVQEAVPGKSVRAAIVRDGQRRDVQITPDDRRSGTTILSDGRMRDYFGNLDHLGRSLEGLWNPPNFDFDYNARPFPFQFESRGRLGVTVSELTPQLASYFGVKDGILVTAVTDDSPAGRAGLKAGDVITRIGGDTVRSREDILRATREARDGAELSVVIVRDKKESTLTVKIEPRRPARRGEPA